MEKFKSMEDISNMVTEADQRFENMQVQVQQEKEERHGILMMLDSAQ